MAFTHTPVSVEIATEKHISPVIDGGVSYIPFAKALAARRSVKPDLMGAPGPDEGMLMELLQAGMSAPDHGGLKPWRFLVFRGEARRCLGDIFRAAYAQDNPNAPALELDAVAAKPYRAPVVVAVYAEIVLHHPKVPPWEQLAAVAMATGNILNAAYAAKMGAILLTGWTCENARVKADLGLAEHDLLLGYLYFGTIMQPPQPVERPPARRFVRMWPEG